MTKVLLISILASLGAASVVWGLYLESFAEKSEYLDVEDFRSSKRKSHCGRKWVFWGVIAEMVLGFGIAVWEGHEMIKTDQHMEQIDPINLPVLNINAFVKLRVKGNVFPDLTQWDSIPLSTNWGSKITTATLCGNAPDSVLQSIPSMISDDFGIGTGFPDSREYFLNFHMESVSAAMILPMQSASKSFGAANFISFGVKFLPPQSEILDGYAFVVVNNSLWKLFRIYPQKYTRPSFPNKEQAEYLSKFQLHPAMKWTVGGSKDSVANVKISTLEPGKLTSLTNGEVFPIEGSLFFNADFAIVGTNVPSGKFDPNW
jgi:hypothetical protein